MTAEERVLVVPPEEELLLEELLLEELLLEPLLVGFVIVVSAVLSDEESSEEEHAPKRTSCNRMDSEKRTEKVCFRTLLSVKKDDGIIPPPQTK